MYLDYVFPVKLQKRSRKIKDTLRNKNISYQLSH